MFDFIHNYMEIEGVPQAKSSREIMIYLQNSGFAFNAARGVIGMAVKKGFIRCIANDNNVKIYI